MAALESGRWLFGENVARFEQEFARYCDTSCLITVANGTDALEIALIAAEAKGREVITVANAGGYTTTACRVIGAIPVYVDIDPETLLISVPSALDAVTPQTVAVVVTHLYGRVADVSALRTGLAAAGREDVVIIEDCAQAHGAQINGKRAGSFGDLATFSFYPTKNLGGMGDGGAIACNKDSYCQIVKWIRQYGWQERYRSILPYGRNSRMDEVQAAILCVKLQYLDDWNRRRRDIVSQYKASSSSFNGWFNDSAGFVAHLAVARHPRRDHVRAQLALSEIMTDIHYPILDCDQQSQDGLLMVMHDLTESRRAISEIMTLPCFPEMSDIEVEQVCESLARLD
jgi:dTDP-4-amino-4,6-dideoxygalactose transaminase